MPFCLSRSLIFRVMFSKRRTFAREKSCKDTENFREIQENQAKTALIIIFWTKNKGFDADFPEKMWIVWQNASPREDSGEGVIMHFITASLEQFQMCCERKCHGSFRSNSQSLSRRSAMRSALASNTAFNLRPRRIIRPIRRLKVCDARPLPNCFVCFINAGALLLLWEAPNWTVPTFTKPVQVIEKRKTVNSNETGSGNLYTILLLLAPVAQRQKPYILRIDCEVPVRSRRYASTNGY